MASFFSLQISHTQKKVEIDSLSLADNAAGEEQKTERKGEQTNKRTHERTNERTNEQTNKKNKKQQQQRTKKFIIMSCQNIEQTR